MKHFSISIHYFEEVQAFVNLAMVQPFEITVGNERQLVKGKNFMGMFSLDFQHPLDVQVDCDDDSYQLFRQKATELFAS